VSPGNDFIDRMTDEMELRMHAAHLKSTLGISFNAAYARVCELRGAVSLIGMAGALTLESALHQSRCEHTPPQER
jgi:hypothetical protein